MRYFVKGKLYDTSTAAKVSLWTDGLRREELYRKRSGRFFLLVTDTLVEEVIPLTYSQAKTWLYLHCERARADALIEATTPDIASLRLQGPVARKLNRTASETGKGKCAIVSELIERFADRIGKEG